MRNFDIIKQDLSDMIFKMNVNELYNFTSLLEECGIELPGSVLKCENCKMKYGLDCDSICEERFIIYCNEENLHEQMLS